MIETKVKVFAWQSEKTDILDPFYSFTPIYWSKLCTGKVRSSMTQTCHRIRTQYGPILSPLSIILIEN